MKRLLNTVTFFVTFFAAVSIGFAFPQVQVEPAIDTQVEWYVGANGMLFTGYDLNGNGIPDYFTGRIVISAYESTEVVATVAKSNPNRLVFFINYHTSTYYYIAASHPLFYAWDIDENGHWDVLFKDALEDGVNGNEVFYDSPSGMFTVEPDVPSDE